MALVVVRHGRTPATLHRQSRLRAVERLDLAVLVHGRHEGVLGWVHVETDDVADLLEELRVVGELEGFDPARLQAVLPPDRMDRGRRQAAHLDHRAQRPVRRGRRLFVQGALDGGGHLLGRGGGRGGGEGAASGWIAEQPGCAALHVARLPAPDGRLAFPRGGTDRRCARAVRGHQHDPRPPDMVLPALANCDHTFQPLPVARAEPNLNAFPHAPRLAGQDKHGESSTPTKRLGTARCSGTRFVLLRSGSQGQRAPGRATMSGSSWTSLTALRRRRSCDRLCAPLRKLKLQRGARTALDFRW
jgi:hypothetical protein